MWKGIELDYSYSSNTVTDLQLQSTYTGLSLRFQVAGYMELVGRKLNS